MPSDPEPSQSEEPSPAEVLEREQAQRCEDALICVRELWASFMLFQVLSFFFLCIGPLPSPFPIVGVTIVAVSGASWFLSWIRALKLAWHVVQNHEWLPWPVVACAFLPALVVSTEAVLFLPALTPFG